MLGPAATACVGWEPAKASVVRLAANTTMIHSVRTTVAVAGRRIPRRLAHLTNMITRPSHTDSARRVTRRRYVTARAAVEEQSSSICPRSSGGSGASGIRPDSAAGRNAPSLRPAHVSHCSQCPVIKSRACSVRRPSQSASSTSSSEHPARPMRAMRSAPRALSSRPRACAVSACAAPRHAEGLGEIVVVQVVPQAQLCASRSRGGSSARMPRISDSSSA